MGLISDGEIWMEMIKSRNQTSHTYDETTTDEISRKIIEEYLPAFFSFKEQMEAIRNREKGKLDLTTLLKIENDLDDLLLPYKTDLSSYEKINSKELIDHIHQEGVVFYEKNIEEVAGKEA